MVLIFDTKSTMGQTILLLDAIINEKTVKLVQFDTMPALKSRIPHLQGSNNSSEQTLLTPYIFLKTSRNLRSIIYYNLLLTVKASLSLFFCSAIA